MAEHKIQKKSEAIKNCIFKTIFNNEQQDSMYDISQKLNRILYRQNLNKKLLEQIFVNLGFPVNEIVENDTLLKQFYKNNNKYFGGID